MNRKSMKGILIGLGILYGLGLRADDRPGSKATDL